MEAKNTSGHGAVIRYEYGVNVYTTGRKQIIYEKYIQ